MIVFECVAGHQTPVLEARTVQCPQCLRIFKRMKKVAGPTPVQLKQAGSDPISRRKPDDIH